MHQNTHFGINPQLCGTPVTLSPGKSVVRLVTIPSMAADDLGLVHGGFIFGQADYAAMLAVNDPNVVLGKAETTFVKPVRVGEIVEAEAQMAEEKDRKRLVQVDVRRDGEIVFSGVFTCFVLADHVLAG